MLNVRRLLGRLASPRAKAIYATSSLALALVVLAVAEGPMLPQDLSAVARSGQAGTFVVSDAACEERRGMTTCDVNGTFTSADGRVVIPNLPYRWAPVVDPGGALPAQYLGGHTPSAYPRDPSPFQSELVFFFLAVVLLPVAVWAWTTRRGRAALDSTFGWRRGRRSSNRGVDDADISMQAGTGPGRHAAPGIGGDARAMDLEDRQRWDAEFAATGVVELPTSRSRVLLALLVCIVFGVIGGWMYTQGDIILKIFAVVTLTFFGLMLPLWLGRLVSPTTVRVDQFGLSIGRRSVGWTEIVDVRLWTGRARLVVVDLQPAASARLAREANPFERALGWANRRYIGPHAIWLPNSNVLDPDAFADWLGGVWRRHAPN